MSIVSKDLPRKANQTKDKIEKVITSKPFNEIGKTIISPDYADRSTWYYSSVRVTGETATDSGDQTNYTFASGKTLINLDNISDRHLLSDKKIVVYEDSVEVSDYIIDYSTNTIVFDSQRSGSPTITVDYDYENGSKFVVTADTNKILKIGYVETQFTEGAALNDDLVFQAVLNNAATGNTDYVVVEMEYKRAADFLNRSNHGTSLVPFGEVTKNVNICPWNYTSGYTILPVGTDTDATKHEFNKLVVFLRNDIPYNSEVATATFYCIEEDI